MENTKITAENLRFFLKVSVTKVNNLRKERATKLKNFLSQQKNKNKEKKLESSSNKFFNNINSIKRKSGGIFRTNAQTLTANTTILATENAQVTGPLTVSSGVTLTVESGGRLVTL